MLSAPHASAVLHPTQCRPLQWQMPQDLALGSQGQPSSCSCVFCCDGEKLKERSACLLAFAIVEFSFPTIHFPSLCQQATLCKDQGYGSLDFFHNEGRKIDSTLVLSMTLTQSDVRGPFCPFCSLTNFWDQLCFLNKLFSLPKDCETVHHTHMP